MEVKHFEEIFLEVNIVTSLRRAKDQGHMKPKTDNLNLNHVELNFFVFSRGHHFLGFFSKNIRPSINIGGSKCNTRLHF